MAPTWKVDIPAARPRCHLRPLGIRYLRPVPHQTPTWEHLLVHTCEFPAACRVRRYVGTRSHELGVAGITPTFIDRGVMDTGFDRDRCEAVGAQGHSRGDTQRDDR